MKNLVLAGAVCSLASGVVAAGLDDNEISLNAGLSYQLSDAWTLGLGFAQAARGKEIGDGFTIDEYLYDGEDIPVVAGDLKPEKVTNIEASAAYSANNLEARFSVYQSVIDDVIFSGYPGNAVYNNIGELESSGVEINLAYRWESVDIYAGFSSVDVELSPRSDLYSVPYKTIDINGYEFVGLGNSRGNTWVMGADYQATAAISVGVNLTYVDDIDIDTLHQALENGWTDGLYTLNKAGYTLFDIYGSWEVSRSLQVNLAVTNLFDKLYLDHSSVGDYSEVFASVRGPYEAGRDIRMSVSYAF